VPDECVEVADGYDQEGALSVLNPQVVCEAVGFAGGAVSVKGDGGLPVEVCGRVVVVEDLEGFGEFGVAAEVLDWFAGRGVALVDADGPVGDE
jgi:hypothetical protein